MAYYFKKDQPGRKGNRVTIATAISSDFKLATGVELNSMKEYEKLVILAQDRDAWRQLVSAVIESADEKRELKQEKREEKRKEAKRLREEELIVNSQKVRRVKLF